MAYVGLSTVGVLSSLTAAGQALFVASSRQRSPQAPSDLDNCQSCKLLNLLNSLIVTGHLANLTEIQTCCTYILQEFI